MSVNFNVRSVNGRLLAALRREPSITIAVCDFTLDFDADDYERQYLAVPAERRGSRESFDFKLGRMLGQRKESLDVLRAAGIEESDLGVALHLERSWWGMESMIHSPVGGRIVAEKEGEEIGDDVGYGPARLLSPKELRESLPELDRVTRAEAEPRYRAQEAADIERLRAEGLTPYRPVDDEAFEKNSWRPFCALREHVRATVEKEAALLKWYD